MKNRIKPLLFLFVTVSLTQYSWAQAEGKSNGAAASSSSKVESLLDSAQKYFQSDYSSEEAYFFGKKACFEAEKTKNLELVNRASHSLIRNCNIEKHYDDVLKYATEAVERNDNIQGNAAHWQSLLDLAFVYKEAYKPQLSLEKAQLSFAIAEALENDSMKCLSYLAVGEALDQSSKKLDGFRYLYNAVKLGEALENAHLKFVAYTAMAKFYNFNEGHSRSIKYNNLRYEEWRKVNPTDTGTLYDILLFGEGVNYFSNNNTLNEELVDEILNYARSHGNANLKREALALYRSHLIEDLNFKRLDQLYNEQFPEELEALRENRPVLHSKVLACLYEYQNKIDSSLYYYRLGEFMLDGENNPILKANSFLRYGQFLERHEMIAEAIDKYERAYELASSVSYYHFMLQASNHLHDLYSQQSNFQKAYQYSMLNKHLEDSLDLMARKDELIVMEFSKEMEKDSLLREQERLETEAEHKKEVAAKKRQTTTVGIVSLFILVLAGALFSRLRYMRRSKAELQTEKDRSDRLLLNILPQDIADELKQKGKAEAKKFENVSILFTDFKDFTQASEAMPAIDLVSEINEYFKLFDQITKEYQVEKIKTIGDAYMAAGGIPRTYTDSVKRTVLAGIEMQSQMGVLNESRRKSGKHFFRMRMGIHTGPVVAGIVGDRKFQYDIWGDSVNVAARMEQAGEVGKVNISGATYEIIKDEPEFTFESRGKIKAKNKGEVEMYFVTKNSEYHA